MEVTCTTYIHSTEPLFTFTFFTKSKFSVDRAADYELFFSSKFPSQLCRFSSGSMKSELVCTRSQSVVGVKSICSELKELSLINGDQLIKGWIRAPVRGSSVWTSGTIYKFTNLVQLQLNFDKCNERGMLSIILLILILIYF